MDLLWGIKSRRSIRKYMQRPVEFDKITAVIEAANYAPSAGNLQDWKFIIVTEKSVRDDIAHRCMEQYWMAEAPVFIVIVSNEERCEQHYGLRGKRLYTIQANAAAAQNMLLAAHALRLGACWVGAFDEQFISDALGIPESHRPQAIITLGYPDEDISEGKRSGLESRVYFNSFGNRLKKPHLVLRDYSVEWRDQASKAAPAMQDGLEKIKTSVKKLRKHVDEHVESMKQKTFK